ncbi:mitoferrin-2-like [Haliotis cracherodii]|uniref:mitoferrin-2-like n=1 Tax=Haliotis rufescens TaxID=6454 RepID=UPI001EB0A271|nr:mitoferrin-2-like [Haliotis rufescens]XP_046360538.1 mitoferrin-2-like [Haliotis rufescens]
MEEDDPYESLPASSTMVTHMVAGAAAGVMEHCVMYPVDCVKTRMQSIVPDPNANYRSLADGFVKILRYEGIKNTMRGISAMVVGAGPAHAMYFACYEKIKSELSNGKQGNHLANGAAGCVATVLHDAVMNPAEVVKQRMQVYGSPYRTCFDCAKTVAQEEGFRAFYRSFTTQLTMNIPFQCLHFMTYEFMQDCLNQQRHYDPRSHVISGALAGAVAAAATMPLDVCKTLLNTQEQCARTKISYVNGMAAAFRTVYEFQGITGYFRGIQPRVIYQMPSTAISWSVYEFFKFTISKKQREDSRYLTSPVKSMPVHAATAASSR